MLNNSGRETGLVWLSPTQWDRLAGQVHPGVRPQPWQPVWPRLSCLPPTPADPLLVASRLRHQTDCRARPKPRICVRTAADAAARRRERAHILSRRRLWPVSFRRGAANWGTAAVLASAGPAVPLGGSTESPPMASEPIPAPPPSCPRRSHLPQASPGASTPRSKRPDCDPLSRVWRGQTPGLEPRVSSS